jgi:hypothetical protein
MTQQDVNRGLRLVRYGGIVITVTVFVFLLGFLLVIGTQIDAATGGGATGTTLSAGMPYLIGFTVLAAVLSVILYFAYRAYAMQRVGSTSASKPA